jgi:preprotein translocase subunit SecG
MHYLLVALHVVVSIALVLIVLLQKGKGADMGAAFGGSSQTVFGSAGATSFLSKVTTAAAIIFMITCLSLAYVFTKGRSSSIMEGVQTKDTPVAEESAAPAAPADKGQAGQESTGE